MADTFQRDFRVEPQLYSKQQAATFLGISVRTIEALLHNRQLVKRKIGARTLIPVSSLKSFLLRDHQTGQSRKREEALQLEGSR